MYVGADGGVDLGGSDLVAEAVVFGGIVEELVSARGDDFGDGEDIFLLFGAEHATVELTALDELFDKHLGVLGEGFAYGGHKIFGTFDFGGGHTAATSGRFDEEGQRELAEDGVGVDGLVAVDKFGFGQAHHAEAAYHGVAITFVEGERGGVEAAGGVGYVQKVEVALEHAVLAWVAVDDDEGEVETHGVAIGALKGEVGTVDGEMTAIVGEPIPAIAIDDNLVDIVFFVVEVFIYLASAVDRDVVFAGEAAHYQGDIFFRHGGFFLVTGD